MDIYNLLDNLEENFIYCEDEFFDILADHILKNKGIEDNYDKDNIISEIYETLENDISGLLEKEFLYNYLKENNYDNQSVFLKNLDSNNCICIELLEYNKTVEYVLMSTWKSKKEFIIDSIKINVVHNQRLTHDELRHILGYYAIDLSDQELEEFHLIATGHPIRTWRHHKKRKK